MCWIYGKKPKLSLIIQSWSLTGLPRNGGGSKLGEGTKVREAETRPALRGPLEMKLQAWNKINLNCYIFFFKVKLIYEPRI